MNELPLTQEDITVINSFISDKALALMRHESKDFAKTSFDPTKFRKVCVGGKIFIIVATTPFIEILYNVLPRACESFPEQFGTRKTETIIDAIYKTSPFGSIKSFSEFLRTEQFAWVLEFQEGKICDRVLRINLFRKIDPGAGGRSDFTGGVFHAFKHFTYKGIPLSTHSEKNDISYPGHIISMLIDAFFLKKGDQISGTHFSSTIPIDDNYHFKYEFYFEPNTRVYFIETVLKAHLRDFT